LVDKVTRLSAKQLGMLGFNCLLSPVLDVLTNPENPVVCTRAFSNEPYLVSRFGRIVAEAISAEGLVPVGKHFPGHGATGEDSHLSLAVNKLPAETVWKIDLTPFKACLDVLPAVLTAHVWVPCIDEEPVPASLSSRITGAVLRDYLEFDGLIMTDDMNMKGLT